jgi:cyclic lactone autoinducer peptide
MLYVLHQYISKRPYSLNSFIYFNEFQILIIFKQFCNYLIWQKLKFISEVMAVTVKIIVFQGMTSCSLVWYYQSFRSTLRSIYFMFKIIIIIIIIIIITEIGLSFGGSGYFTCIQNIKLVTTKFKSGGLHEKHMVATWNLGKHLSTWF